jgi:hypothetical protein
VHRQPCHGGQRCDSGFAAITPCEITRCVCVPSLQCDCLSVVLVTVGEILPHPLCSKWLAMCVDDAMHCGDVIAPCDITGCVCVPRK